MVDINTAISNYRKGLGDPDLPVPQLSPELLKALNVGGKRIGLSDLFPKGIPGGTDSDESQKAYENFLTGTLGIDKDKLKPSDRTTRFGKGLQTLTDIALPSLFGLGKDFEKGIAALDPGGAKFSSPLVSNLGQYIFGERADKDFFKDPAMQPQGQDILRKLSAQDRMQQGQSSSVIRDEALAKKASKLVDSLSGVSGGDQVISQDDELIDTKGFQGVEDALVAQEKFDKEADEKARDAVLAAEEDAEAEAGKDIPLSAEEKKAQAQQTLFKEAMDDINAIYGEDSKTDKKRKTLEDYKADFAKATGIDVSGEPDNKLALMSLGLSLMQNRAGKDFNLSNIIGAAGAAGQKALPLFEKARQEARAGQVAAGKYALGERKADITAELATAKEKRAALAGVAKEFRGYANKAMLERMKHKNQLDIKRLEFESKGINPKGKLTESRILNQPNLKINKGYVAGNNNIVFLNAESEAKAHANAYTNVLEAENSIGKMENLIREIGQKPTADAVSIFLDRGKRLLQPLGIGGADYSKGFNLTKEEIQKNITPEAQIRILQDRLISQYKKFLTKETGNGVSEGDIKRLNKLLGEINPFQPLEENLQRFQELRTIFAQPKKELESVFTDFANRKNHMNDDSYNNTMAVINRAISTGTDGLASFGVESDGSITIDLR
tara:strand:- start:417 stop:2420 length:2004 start_codon:yes stop_codon:yes gene_type:complete